MDSRKERLWEFSAEVAREVVRIMRNWDRALVIEAAVIVALTGALHVGGIPVPQCITVACWPVIIFNLCAAAWNLR